MTLTDSSALELGLVFLAPGFISLKVWDLLVPSEHRELSTATLDVVVYGALNFALLVGPLLAVGALGALEPAHPAVVYIMAVVALFLMPAAWPVAVHRIRRSGWLKRLGVVHPTPKPWDYVFGSGEGYWVVLHMKDGRRIGGRYDIKSFASSFPKEEQLYLEEVWELDAHGRIRRRVERSKGIMVAFANLDAIEFFSRDEGDVRA